MNRHQLDHQIKQVRVRPCPLAVNTALPAFAVELHAVALCYRSPAASDRAVSKFKAAPPLLQRDRQTDARQLHRPCSAYYVGSANTLSVCLQTWSERLWSRSNSLSFGHDVSLRLKIANNFIQFFDHQAATIDHHPKHSDDIIVGPLEIRWLGLASWLARLRGVISIVWHPLLKVAHYQRHGTLQRHVPMFCCNNTI